MEGAPEQRQHPTNEQITQVFQTIVGDRFPSGCVDPQLDEHGDILVLTFLVTNADSSREEYQYIRPRAEQGGDNVPVILVSDIREDGTASESKIVAEYKNGKWKMLDSGEREPTT